MAMMHMTDNKVRLWLLLLMMMNTATLGAHVMARYHANYVAT